MPNFKHIREDLISILLVIKEKMRDSANYDWTAYENGEELRNEIDSHINKLKQNDLSIIDSLAGHFSPSSTFQEHSLQNDWSEEYIVLSTKFDEVYALLKNHT